MVAGLTYNFLPFMVLPLFASIDKIDPRLIEASSDLYATPVVGFFKVTWPLSMPGVVSGTLLTFIPAAGDYINVQLLGSPNQRMVGNGDPEPVHRRERLPGGGGAVDDPDDHDPGAGLVLRPPRGDGGAAVTRRTGAGCRWLRKHLVLILGLLVLLYTFVPIFVVVLMSFNDPASRVVYQFDGFTLHNWLNPCEPEGMCGALRVSIEIGLLATLGATILGTLMAFALVRHDFVGRSGANLLIFLPMAAPEIVLGSSLLALFVAAGSQRRARVLDDPGRAHHVLPVVRRRDRPGAAGRPRRQPRAGGHGPLRHTVADVLAGDLPAGLPGHPRRRPAELLAVVRRLHHHQPQRRQHHDVPDVRLGCRPARRTDAGQRRSAP